MPESNGEYFNDPNAGALSTAVGGMETLALTNAVDLWTILGRNEPPLSGIVGIDVPDGIDLRRQRIASNEESLRRAGEIKLQRRAKPALHLLSCNDAPIPVPTHNLPVILAKPAQLDVEISKRLVIERQRKPAGCVWNSLVLDNPGNHFGSTADKRFLFETGALVVENPDRVD
jgi:hypothetical protein